ncbi:MAG TPA: hypothetical protein VIS72_18720 [Anaerolineales bacterium]
MNTSAKIHDTNWQILGELGLTSDVGIDDAVHAWLVDVLTHLNLSPTFWGMVSTSVQESVRHAVQTITTNGHSHIHISILIPRGQILVGKPWGFFHVERIESGADEIKAHHYAIVFYLYVEGG